MMAAHSTITCTCVISRMALLTPCLWRACAGARRPRKKQGDVLNLSVFEAPKRKATHEPEEGEEERTGRA